MALSVNHPQSPATPLSRLYAQFIRVEEVLRGLELGGLNFVRQQIGPVPTQGLPTETVRQNLAQWLAGRIAAKAVARELSGQGDAGVIQEVTGRPWLQLTNGTRYALSISHTQVWAGAVVGASVTTGLDIEEIRPRHPALYRKLLTPDWLGLCASIGFDQLAPSFAITWTLREAFFKCSGRWPDHLTLHPHSAPDPTQPGNLQEALAGEFLSFAWYAYYRNRAARVRCWVGPARVVALVESDSEISGPEAGWILTG